MSNLSSFFKRNKRFDVAVCSGALIWHRILSLGIHRSSDDAGRSISWHVYFQHPGKPSHPVYFVFFPDKQLVFLPVFSPYLEPPHRELEKDKENKLECRDSWNEYSISTKITVRVKKQPSAFMCNLRYHGFPVFFNSWIKQNNSKLTLLIMCVYGPSLDKLIVIIKGHSTILYTQIKINIKKKKLTLLLLLSIVQWKPSVHQLTTSKQQLLN